MYLNFQTLIETDKEQHTFNLVPVDQTNLFSESCKYHKKAIWQEYLYTYFNRKQ